MMKSSKHLRIIVSSLQVLLVIAAGILQHALERLYLNSHIDRPDIVVRYAGTFLDIVLKVNFPLEVLWAPILFLMNSAFFTPMRNGPPAAIVIVLLDIFILASVALFWYVVTAEAQARSCGNSLIRFSKRWLEIPKTVIFFLLGVCAIAYAFWDGHRRLILGELNQHNLYWSSVIDSVVGGVFLLIWAIILIKLSIGDLTLALRSDG